MINRLQAFYQLDICLKSEDYEKLENIRSRLFFRRKNHFWVKQAAGRFLKKSDNILEPRASRMLLFIYGHHEILENFNHS